MTIPALDLGSARRGGPVRRIRPDASRAPHRAPLVSPGGAGCPGMNHDIGGTLELVHGGKCCRLDGSLDPRVENSTARTVALLEAGLDCGAKRR